MKSHRVKNVCSYNTLLGFPSFLWQISWPGLGRQTDPQFSVWLRTKEDLDGQSLLLRDRKEAAGLQVGGDGGGGGKERVKKGCTYNVSFISQIRWLGRTRL